MPVTCRENLDENSLHVRRKEYITPSHFTGKPTGYPLSHWTSSHTCITGRASLALRSTPEAAKPVPPCQSTKDHQIHFNTLLLYQCSSSRDKSKNSTTASPALGRDLTFKNKDLVRRKYFWVDSEYSGWGLQRWMGLTGWIFSEFYLCCSVRIYISLFRNSWTHFKSDRITEPFSTQHSREVCTYPL